MKERKRVQKMFPAVGRTKQEFKAECDLGLILKRFGRTAEGQAALEQMQNLVDFSRYADVSEVPDFRAAQDIVLAAQERFDALPAILRKRFDNDPAAFLDFAVNPANLDEMRSLGLAKPAPKESVESQVSEDVS